MKLSSNILRKLIDDNRHAIVAFLLKNIDCIYFEKPNDVSYILYTAVSHGHTETVNVLLEKGDQIQLKEKVKIVSILEAALKNINLLDLLLKKLAPVSPENTGQVLHRAVRQSNFKSIKALVDNGADVNLSMNYKTPIFKTYNKKIIEYLLINGADINAKCESGYSCDTALELATEYGNVKKVKLLIDYGVDLNRKSHRAQSSDKKKTTVGENACRIATSMGNEKIVQLLLENGVKCRP